MKILTLLCLALGCGEVSLAAVGKVGTTIELLVAGSLKGSTKANESVSIDRERTVCVSGIENGRGRYTTEGASEGLRVALASDDTSVSGGNSGQDSESGGELHDDDVI